MPNVTNRIAQKVTVLFLLLLAALAVCISPPSAFADDGTTIKVDTASAFPGDIVQVAVSIENNPGVLGAVLQITYDEGLMLTDATSGDAFSSLSMTKPGSFASPCQFTWDGMEIDARDVKDGEVLLLTFEVSENAETRSTLNVTVSDGSGTLFDASLSPIEVTYAAGGIYVYDFIPGDLDGDKLVNSKDVIHARRHIVGGYAQNINLPAADVNNDLKVDAVDVILLRRSIAGGYGVNLVRSDLKADGSGCAHSLRAVAAKSPTCTEDGSIAYWHCATCGKYFSDQLGITEIQPSATVVEALGHLPVLDAAVAPTQTATGLTEGSHCSRCGEVLKVQEVIPVLGDGDYSITFDIANGDTYLAGLSITNPNKTVYHAGDSFRLSSVSADGYRFLGWYDGAGDDATRITRITADDADNLELYAHWQVVTYTVQYESDLFLDTASSTYTVDKGLVLPTPKLSNYVFAGWTDGDGKLYASKVPVGTTGNLTLAANWTSERNKTYTNPNPKDPIVIENEDENVILFAYEIGRIENVPQYVIKDFGYISGDGVTRSATETYTAQTSQSTMEQLSNVVANATTNSSNWTLSSDWNETTSVSEDWAKTNGYTREESETIAKSNSTNWNISNSSSGSSSSTNSASATDGWSNEIKVNGSDKTSTTDGWKNAAELNTKVSAEYSAGASVGFDGMGASVGYKVGAEVGTKLSGEQTHSSTTEKSRGFEMGGSQNHTGTTSSSATNTASWGSTASYGGSATTSKSNTVSTALSETISQQKHYGQSYSHGGSESQGLATSTSTSTSDSYTSATTYNTAASESVTNSWTTAATKPGYHRWIVAGTAHVYGVVGYDIESKSFFVYTYSIMDDETHEFEDYSYTTAAYNDNENGVISFEIPYDEVMQTVSDRVYSSDGLKVNLETGKIVGYTGADTRVVIPEYYNAGNGDVVKITGFTTDAFAGNKKIVTVVLSDYIESILDGAFAGCTSLAFVEGAGVTSIGASAFADCPSMEDCGVFSKVTHLGENAFAGAERVYVNAANKDVATAAMASGAKGLVLNVRFLEDNEDVLDGVTLTAPDTMEYFELNGESHKVNGETRTRAFYGLKVDSHAGETILNKINIMGTSSLPVKISSPKVTLNQSKITSPGIALALTADSTSIGLRGTSTVSSTNANAMLSKNLRLYETASDVVGELVVPQKLLVCGSIDGDEYLQCDNVETIDEDTFHKLLSAYLLYFDAGAGTCDVEPRELVYGVPVGELPVPTRDYCTFDGWYLAGTDTLVTESTVLDLGSDLTLNAHWKVNWETDIPDGVYSFVASANSGYSLEMPGGQEKTAGAKMQLYRTNNCICQRFRLTKESDGSYKISQVLGDLTLEAYGTNEYGWPYVRQAVDQGLDTQRWYIHQTSDGWYSLRNKGNNMYIDITNGEMKNCTMIECHSGNGDSAQKFNVKKERYALYEVGLYNVGRSWDDAKAICESTGGHLATITSSTEQKAVTRLLVERGTPMNCYWLGGFRVGTKWNWVTNEQFSYSNWAQGQPDSNNAGAEDKLMMCGNNGVAASSQWNDIEPNIPVRTSELSYYNFTNFGLICEWEDEAASSGGSSASELSTAFSSPIGG